MLFYRQNAGTVGAAFTNANGEYVSPDLPSGTYFVRAGNVNEYIDELFEDMPCPHGGCNPDDGTPILVDSNTVEGIDFDLNPAGSISGQVTTSDGTPLSTTIRIFDSVGNTLGFVSSNQNGNYVVLGLDQADYFVATSGFNDYIDELYDDLPCPSFCDPTQGTPVSVSYGNDTGGIDFQLDLGGTITGAVVDSNTLEPITGGRINIYNSSGNFVDSTSTSFPAATYISSGLASGNYFVETDFTEDYMEELYDNIPCPFDQCDVLNGTPVPVVIATITDNINFQLGLSGTISGTITDESNSPLANISVQAFHSSGQFAFFSQTNENGNYTIEDLVTGDYFVRTSSNYLDEAFDDIICEFCPAGTGDPVSVVTGSDTPGIDFELSKGGIITGTITDSITQDPIFNAFVFLHDSNGNSVDVEFSDGSGIYTFSSLLPGNYFLTTNTSGNYVDELYDDIPCNFCNVLNGTPIAVALGTPTTGIDVALTPAGRISGTIRSEANGQPLPANIDIYDVSGIHVASGSTDELGFYSVRILTSGNYYVVAQRFDGYLRELYDGVHCSEISCNFALGVQVPVTVGAITPGIDINLDRGGSISGSVIDEFSATPIPFVSVFIYDSNGRVVEALQTNQNGIYVSDTTLVTGNYFVRTSSSFGYTDEVYDNHPCNPTCVVLDGDPVSVTEGSTTPNIDFVLNRPAVSINDVSITEEDSGTQMMNFTVALSQAAQHIVTVSFEDDDGSAFGNFDFQPVWGNLQIFPGNTSGVISVPIYGDTQLEPDEMFSMRLTVAFNANIADDNGVGTILNDDGSCPIITVNPATLPDGTINESYSQILSGFGGTAPYSFAVTAGSLPPGLSLIAHNITGTPTTAGTFNITVSVTDADGCPGAHDYSITILESCQFRDDFEDGTIDASKWTINKPGFIEQNGNFIGTPSNKKAQAIATGFAGCGGTCTATTTMQSAGGFGSKVIALGWYQNKSDKFEIVMNQAAGSWTLRQRVNGKIAAKEKVSTTILANTAYSLQISFDGNQFQVVIDGNLAIILDKAVGSVPFGTFGYEVKNTTGQFSSVCVN